MSSRKDQSQSRPDLAEASMEVQPSESGPAPDPGAAADPVAELKAELEEAVAARMRALADFANYQKRALENESRAERNATMSVIRSLLGVLDHYDLALGQDPRQVTAQQLLGGVRMVRDELDSVLERHGVARIEPQVGEEFDPIRHEAVMRKPTQDVPPGHIASVLQAGYALGEVVLRPARVVVAAEPAEGQ